jgi:hypothetical protein
VQSDIQYVLNVLSGVANVPFDDRQVVDVPLRTEQQVEAARILEFGFKSGNLSNDLRNGANAVCIYGAEVIDL